MALDTLKDRYQIIWPLESGTFNETFLAEDKLPIIKVESKLLLS